MLSKVKYTFPIILSDKWFMAKSRCSQGIMVQELCKWYNFSKFKQIKFYIFNILAFKKLDWYNLIHKHYDTGNQIIHSILPIFFDENY